MEQRFISIYTLQLPGYTLKVWNNGTLKLWHDEDEAAWNAPQADEPDDDEEQLISLGLEETRRIAQADYAPLAPLAHLRLSDLRLLGPALTKGLNMPGVANWLAKPRAIYELDTPKEAAAHTCLYCAQQPEAMRQRAAYLFRILVLEEAEPTSGKQAEPTEQAVCTLHFGTLAQSITTPAVLRNLNPKQDL